MSEHEHCRECGDVNPGPMHGFYCTGPRLSRDDVATTIQEALGDVAERLKRRAEALRAASPHAAEAIFLVANELEPEPDRRTLPESDEVEIRPIDDEGSGP